MEKMCFKVVGMLTLIEHRDLPIAKTGKLVRKNASHNDALVLLLHHWSCEMANIQFHSEKSGKIWLISTLCQEIKKELKPLFLFLQAWTECNLVSAICHPAKNSFAKRFLK